MVCGHGINDMQRGWTTDNEWNKKVYQKWNNMIYRCYSEKYHEKYPAYIGCSVCSRWLLLSNFVDDFSKIDGYDEEKFLNSELELDKDIKSNGINKYYSFENCILVDRSDNVKQANKTRYYKTGIDHPLSIRIAQYDKQENLIQVWNGSHEIKRELGISNSQIISCCKFWEINCNKEEWFKTHKKYPCKTCGGYIFKYFKEDDKID